MGIHDLASTVYKASVVHALSNFAAQIPGFSTPVDIKSIGAAVNSVVSQVAGNLAGAPQPSKGHTPS